MEKNQEAVIAKIGWHKYIGREPLRDFYNNPDPGLKTYLEERKVKAWNELMKDFKQAQQKGIFRSDLKVEFLFYISQKMSEFINDEKLLKLYKTPQDLIMKMANFLAYGFSPRE